MIKYFFFQFYSVGAASRLFEDLNHNTLPIASASLGQVYKLKLRSESQNVNQVSDPSWCRCKKHCEVIDEKIVAVKVQRPDMRDHVLRGMFIYYIYIHFEIFDW